MLFSLNQLLWYAFTIQELWPRRRQLHRQISPIAGIERCGPQSQFHSSIQPCLPLWRRREYSDQSYLPWYRGSPFWQRWIGLSCAESRQPFQNRHSHRSTPSCNPERLHWSHRVQSFTISARISAIRLLLISRPQLQHLPQKPCQHHHRQRDQHRYHPLR